MTTSPIPFGTPHCLCTADGIEPECPWHGTAGTEADQ